MTFCRPWNKGSTMTWNRYGLEFGLDWNMNSNFCTSNFTSLALREDIVTLY